MVQMNKSGLWKGVVHNRIGHFKFINVEILNDRVPRRGEPERGKWGQRYRQKPGSVQELLQRMNLQVESNISPRLEQTDSHLHAVECKVERTCFYTFLYSASLSRRLPPSPFIPPLPTIVRIGFPTYTLYNSQVPQTMTSPFCSIPPFLFVSFSLFPLPVYRSLPPPCSFLSSPTPIYPIPSFTFSLDRSFSLRFTANVRFIRSIKSSLILFFKPFLF